MGSWFAASKNRRVTHPFTPGPVKYSCLARKCTWRSSMAGMNTESETDRWLLARIAGPSVGTFPRPFTQGRNSRRVAGATANVLADQ